MFLQTNGVLLIVKLWQSINLTSFFSFSLLPWMSYLGVTCFEYVNKVNAIQGHVKTKRRWFMHRIPTWYTIATHCRVTHYVCTHKSYIHGSVCYWLKNAFLLTVLFYKKRFTRWELKDCHSINSVWEKNWEFDNTMLIHNLYWMLNPSGEKYSRSTAGILKELKWQRVS